jgi:hypothetical protein
VTPPRATANWGRYLGTVSALRRLTTVRFRLTLLRLPLQATPKPLRFVRLRSCTISSPSRHGTRFRFYSVEEQERTPNLREMGAAITTADTVSPEFCFRNSLRNQHSCLASPCTVWCFPTTHYRNEVCVHVHEMSTLMGVSPWSTQGRGRAQGQLPPRAVHMVGDHPARSHTGKE